MFGNLFFCTYKNFIVPLHSNLMQGYFFRHYFLPLFKGKIYAFFNQKKSCTFALEFDAKVFFYAFLEINFVKYSNKTITFAKNKIESNLGKSDRHDLIRTPRAALPWRKVNLYTQFARIVYKNFFNYGTKDSTSPP